MIQKLKTGAGYFFKGQSYVVRDHPEVLRYCLVPMIFGVLFFAGTSIAFVHYFSDLMEMLWQKPDCWLLQIIWLVFKAVAALVSFVTMVLLTILVFMVSAAPFNDVISENIEGIEGTWDARPFSIKFLLSDALESILLELSKAGKKLLWLAPLYLFSLLVPVVGQAVYIFFGGYKMSHMLGMDYVDWSLARRGYTWKERFEFARVNRWILVGFGSMVMLSGMIPVGFVIFWPGTIAGGTLLCSGLKPEDRRKDRKRIRKRYKEHDDP